MKIPNKIIKSHAEKITDFEHPTYKDAINTLTSAKEEVETATASMQEEKYQLDESIKKADAFTKAIDSFIAKVRDIKFKAKVDDADIEKLTDDRKKLIGDESKLLENHRKANKEILIRHFYDMSNMMSRNEGVWLSNDWVKTLLWYLFHLLFIL